MPPQVSLLGALYHSAAFDWAMQLSRRLGGDLHAMLRTLAAPGLPHSLAAEAAATDGGWAAFERLGMASGPAWCSAWFAVGAALSSAGDDPVLPAGAPHRATIASAWAWLRGSDAEPASQLVPGCPLRATTCQQERHAGTDVTYRPAQGGILPASC